jgi:phage recombination protein Bet
MRTKTKKKIHRTRPVTVKQVEAIVRKSNEIRPVIVQQGRRRLLTEDEISLLQRTVANGTSPDEFKLFLWVCQKHKVDPLTRQIHCVMRYTKHHHQEEQVTQDGKNKIMVWVGGKRMVIQMGIDGYRSLAARDHEDFGGCDEPEYEFGTEKLGKKLIPTVARIRLWKKGLDHPVVGVAYWDEYAPADMEDSQAFMWKKMPKHMLAKCAEALAIRKGYPELADIYTNEEMAQANDGYTPEGRQIDDGSQFAGGSRAAADRVAQRKIAAGVEGRAKEVESQKAAIDVKPLPPAATAGSPTPQATPAATTPRTEPAKSKSEPKKGQEATSKAKPAPSAGVPVSNTPPADIGTLEKVVEGVTAPRTNKEGNPVGGGSPYLRLKLNCNTQFVTLFDNKEVMVDRVKMHIFDILRNGVGQRCVFQLEKVTPKTAGKEPCWNVKAVIQVGAAEWLEDGTPVVRRESATRNAPRPGEERQASLLDEGMVDPDSIEL